jgi:anti-sigma B factor antagonist
METSAGKNLSNRDGHPFTVTVQESAVGHRVLLRGELDLATGKGLADRICAAGGSRVVVDLSGLTFIDSSGIAQLLEARDRLFSAGHEPLFVNPSQTAGRLFEVSGLSSLITDDPRAS